MMGNILSTNMFCAQCTTRFVRADDAKTRPINFTFAIRCTVTKVPAFKTSKWSFYYFNTIVYPANSNTAVLPKNLLRDRCIKRHNSSFGSVCFFSTTPESTLKTHSVHMNMYSDLFQDY
uniref:Putative product n=1 Tax=Xenopsylla cheopis TaxID=163159 RepID=A0A6M2DQF4_XENCH